MAGASNWVAMGSYAYFWSPYEDNRQSDAAFLMHLSSNNADAYWVPYNKSYAFSVRCVEGFGSYGWDTRENFSSSEVVNYSSSSESVNPTFSSEVVNPVLTETLTDPRDGQTYKTVTIGTQTWMAENLNYKTANSYCPGYTASNCTKYGRLYESTELLCPSGWHLPSVVEFETLFEMVGGQSTAATALKSTSGWSGNGNGTDAIGFSALPAGFMDGYDFYGEGSSARFWSSGTYVMRSSSGTYVMHLYSDRENATIEGGRGVNSVRCLKDDSNATVNPFVTGALTDPRDRQTYKTVTIGEQTWMAENLNYETGTLIYEFDYESEGSFCYEDNVSNCTKYGRLYAWEAAMTACPSGWHLPSKAEFETLFEMVGGEFADFTTRENTAAAMALKSTSGWRNGNGTDIFGFSALPAGIRKYYEDCGIKNEEGFFHYEGYGANFWTSSKVENRIDGDVYYVGWGCNCYNEWWGSGAGICSMAFGLSVRCIKD